MRRTGRTARLTLMLSGLALVGSACSDAASPRPLGEATSGGSGGKGGSTELNFELASALQPFTACDDLLDYLHREAESQVTAYGLAGIGYGYGLDGGFPAMTVPLQASAESAVDGASSSQVTSRANPGGYSGTNTVEADIDEGDVVKTDGKHLFLLAQNKLRIVPTGNGAPEQLAELALPGYAAQLVTVGDTLLVTGQPDDSGSTNSGAIRSALWEVDVSDPAQPRLQRQLIVDGQILGIRLTDGVARVVVQSQPDDLGFVTPSNPAGEDRALASNKEVIAESSIDDWLGGYLLTDGTGKQISDGRLARCSSVARPAEFHGFATTTVLSIDMGGGLREPNGSAVLADGQRIYSSAENLYVAIGAWQDPIVAMDDVGAPSDLNRDSEPILPSPPETQTVTTAIHRFSFDGDRADYTASGEVTGSLLNDFSMSELDGVLRVATTAGTPWARDTGSESFVTTLRASGTTLEQIGQVGNLGKGEKIYSVRFVGTTGYVVTFRQTDPLYVVDLRDPAAPAVSGELKINGYSAYLHPLDDGRLLGVGQDADDSGRVTAAQVSIFDVSNPAAPTRTAAYQIPGGWLNAEYDYKAFLWWAPEQLLLLPANTAGIDGPSRTGVLALQVGETVTEKGFIDATTGFDGCPQPIPVDDGSGSGSGTTIYSDAGCYGFAPPIERTTIVDDAIYSLSYNSLQSNNLETLAPQGSVEFQ